MISKYFITFLGFKKLLLSSFLWKRILVYVYSENALWHWSLKQHLCKIVLGIVSCDVAVLRKPVIGCILVIKWRLVKEGSFQMSDLQFSDFSDFQPVWLSDFISFVLWFFLILPWYKEREVQRLCVCQSWLKEQRWGCTSVWIFLFHPLHPSHWGYQKAGRCEEERERQRKWFGSLLWGRHLISSWLCYTAAAKGATAGRWPIAMLPTCVVSGWRQLALDRLPTSTSVTLVCSHLEAWPMPGNSLCFW